MCTAYIRGDCLFQGEDSLCSLAVLKGAVCLSLPFACCHGLHVSGKRALVPARCAALLCRGRHRHTELEMTVEPICREFSFVRVPLTLQRNSLNNNLLQTSLCNSACSRGLCTMQCEGMPFSIKGFYCTFPGWVTFNYESKKQHPE